MLYYPTGTCLPGFDGASSSAIVTCTAATITITTFPTSTTCSGSSSTVLNDAGCGADEINGNWLCVPPATGDTKPTLSTEAGLAIAASVGAAAAAAAYGIVKLVPKYFKKDAVKQPLLAGTV